MNIYILEDQLYHQQRLETCLQELSKTLKIPLRIVVITGKPNELLQSITAFGRDQFYLLDIRLKSEKTRGLEVAQAIRKKDNLATIVFITTYSEFAAITYSYKVEALDFIDKNQKEEAFRQALADSLEHTYRIQQQTVSEDLFEVHQKGRHIRIPFQDINYIETSPVPHKLVLLTNQHRIEFYDSMKRIEKQENRLFRAHKSFLINPQRVLEINRSNYTISFSNSQSCLISRRKIKELENRLDIRR